MTGTTAGNDKGTADAGAIRRKGLSKSSLLGILTQLRGWIEKLKPADTAIPASGSATSRTSPSTLTSPTRCISRVIAALRKSTSLGSDVPQPAA